MADIVYVDDDRAEFMAHAQADQAARIEPFNFEADGVDAAAFEVAKTAKLWLFDFFLVSEPTETDQDENGLSLFQKWRQGVAARPVTVLISNNLEAAVGGPIGPVERQHVVAQRQGVEWVGDKSAATFARVIELADAATVIDNALNAHDDEAADADRLVVDVLGAPKDACWINSARRQVDRARPPREPSTTAIVGWLVAHVLPYPSFLLTDAQAALRLRITPASFRALVSTLADEKDIANGKELAACRYRGPLDGFLGRRWWRAAIDDLAWRLSEAEAGYWPSLRAMNKKSQITRLEQDEPVLVSNADLVETDEVAEASDCVRVTEEDFPASVEPAWVHISAVKEDRKLRAKVVFEDRDLASEPA